MSHRIILTGAAGFIGSQVARLLLREGHEVTALVSPTSNRWRIADIEDQLRIVPSDLRDLSSVVKPLSDLHADFCIHLAWHGWSGPAAAEQNLSSLSVSVELLKLMPAIGCGRFLAAGTCFEYDVQQDRLAETTPLKPVNLYGQCKKALHEVAIEFARITDVRVLTPRLFYTYGPFEDTRRVVPAIVLSLLRGEEARVTPGMQVRDYLHVEDVAAAIWASAQSQIDGAVNIASGIPVTIAEIATLIGELIGRSELVQLGAIAYREKDPMRVLADVTLLRSGINWAPRYSLAQGMMQTIEWWASRVQRVGH